MLKSKAYCTAVLGIAISMAGSASAIQLKGTNHIGADLNVINWGNQSELLDKTFNRSYGASVFGNYSLAPSWDFTAAYSGVWDSEDNWNLEAHTGQAGLNYLICTKSSIIPYAGASAGIVYSEIDDGVNESSETDAAFGAQLGAEWDVCKDALIDVSAFYAYVDTGVAGNNGAYGLSASTALQLIDHLMLTGGAAYTFEDEDAVLSVGTIIQW